MKNKSIKFRSSYFFRQRKRFSGKDSAEHPPEEVVKPESEGAESVIEDILRWADDGGQMLPAYRQGKPGDSSGTDKHMMNKEKKLKRKFSRNNDSKSHAFDFLGADR